MNARLTGWAVYTDGERRTRVASYELACRIADDLIRHGTPALVLREWW